MIDPKAPVALNASARVADQIAGLLRRVAALERGKATIVPRESTSARWYKDEAVEPDPPSNGVIVYSFGGNLKTVKADGSRAVVV